MFVGAVSHAAVVVISEANERFRISDREVFHQDRVYQREDGRVGAQAEGEGENCGGGKRRGLAQLAKRKTHVLEKRTQHAWSPGLVCTGGREDGERSTVAENAGRSP